MSKKGFELSLSFIVVIVLAIVVFALGLFMLSKFLGGAKEIKSDLDERTETQLSNLLQSGQRVVIPFNSVSIRRGDSAVLGLGILNIGDSGSFKINIGLSKALDKSNFEISAPGVSGWLRYEKGDFRLEKNEQRKEVILVEVPSRGVDSGTYILNVDVLKNGQTYDIIKKIYITVP